MIIDPTTMTPPEFHGWLLGAVTPRPIALASTQDTQGNVNLSPFSFFNCFGSNPPILVFSPARRGRDNTTKHTYENLMEVPEVVIHIVDYSIVQQVSLASTEYPRGANEFQKAGFTEEPSERVRPPRVREAPVAMECKVVQILPTGEEGGAGNLVICQVVLMRVHDRVVGDDGRIDPGRLDAVARLGQDWYCRVQGDTVFKVPRPRGRIALGMDRLPDHIRRSEVLTGNDLAQLALVEEVPEIDLRFQDDRMSAFAGSGEAELHRLAQTLIAQGRIDAAWQVLLRAK